MARPLADDLSPDPAPAAETRLAGAAVNATLVLIPAVAAVGMNVVADARATRGDRSLEHRDDGRSEPLALGTRDSSRPAGRPESGAIQGLVGVDVAEPLLQPGATYSSQYNPWAYWRYSDHDDVDIYSGRSGQRA